MRVGGFEVGREVKCDNGEAGVVACARFAFVFFEGCGAFCASTAIAIPRRWVECVHALSPVDVTHADIPPCCFEGAAEKPGVGQAGLHYCAIARKAKVDQVKVLRYYLGAGAGEVERVGVICAAKVVEFEN